MTPEQKVLRILKSRRRERLWLKFCCFFGFHVPYYKYGPDRNITYNTNPPAYSNGPEHLGYHCKLCELPLGRWRPGKYWFQITIPR